jgi:Tol biopolymer transport system component
MWSPDGTQIVFVGREPGSEFQLFTMNADGRGAMALTQTNTRNRDPMWTPDGETLIYRFERVAGSASYDLFSLHLPTGVFRNLTDNNPDTGAAVISPDGTQIAYVNDNRTVRLAHLPFGEVYMETSNSTRAPAWSPDGTRVAYVGPRDRFASSVIDTLYIVDAQPDDQPRRIIFDDLMSLD